MLMWGKPERTVPPVGPLGSYLHHVMCLGRSFAPNRLTEMIDGFETTSTNQSPLCAKCPKFSDELSP